jgi:hypothetical protein
VFNELTKFALRKVCFVVRFIIVFEVFNSLPPFWMLVGRFVFFLQWDITYYHTRVHLRAEGPDTFVGKVQRPGCESSFKS